MTTYAAFLRAINLGPTRKVPMAELRKLLEEQGYGNVRTLLQSGNVLLDADEQEAKLRTTLESLLQERFGFEIPTMVRTTDELQKTLEANPLREIASDPKRHLVTFLEKRPTSQQQRALESADIGDERLAITGRELHTWHPDGVRQSKITRLAERHLDQQGTARNWATLTKLLTLADS